VREVTRQEICHCPYYFGADTGSYRGDHKEFCDFEIGRDPVSFGFPEHRGRYWWG
jgi:hypothetical protein